jgi:hypothetical protein
LRTFDGYHFADRFHHANDLLLSHAIGTNGTDIAISHIITTLAKFDLVAHA